MQERLHWPGLLLAAFGAGFVVFMVLEHRNHDRWVEQDVARFRKSRWFPRFGEEAAERHRRQQNFLAPIGRVIFGLLGVAMFVGGIVILVVGVVPKN